jgi:hypothetical protein
MSAAFLFKIVIVLLLIIILFSLTSGMIFLVRDKGQSNRMVKSLTIRIVLSITLFILLFIGFRMGWIQPHGINPKQPENNIPETERALLEQRP